MFSETLAPTRELGAVGLIGSQMGKMQSARAHMQTRTELAGHVERAAAEALMARKYAQRGYGEGHKLPAECDTFVAFLRSAPVATVSLSVDGARGLPSDRIFRQELDKMRASGARLCELTRFAVDLPSPSITVLNNLFAAVHSHGLRNYDCTDLIITADARHREFYRRRWRFACVGSAKLNSASGALSQLMRVRVSSLGARDENFRARRPSPLGALATVL